MTLTRVLNLPENGRNFFILKMSTTNKYNEFKKNTTNRGKFVVCKKIRGTQFGGEKLLNF